MLETSTAPALEVGRSLLIQTLSQVHTGNGQSKANIVSVLEKNQIPVIAKSTLKSAFRKQYRESLAKDGLDWDATKTHPELINHFGETAESGVLEFDDATVFALPLRTSKGVFVWVTCPSALKAAYGLEIDKEQASLEAFEAFTSDANPALLSKKSVLIEEYLFKQKSVAPFEFTALTDTHPDFWTEERLSRLVVVNSAQWVFFLQHHLSVVAYGTPDKATWAKALPPETLLITGLKGPSAPYTPPTHAFLGGHLSSGAGLCQIFMSKETP